jgi:hypothetical protein
LRERDGFEDGEMSETFVGTLAFIFGILSSRLVVMRFLTWVTYTDKEKIHDRMNGVKAEFPLMGPTIVAIICWTWVFTH